MNAIDKAQDIVNRGEKNHDYGPLDKEMEKAADIFNSIRGNSLTGEDILYIMMSVKLARQQHKYKFDNIVDFIGYANGLEYFKK